MTDPTPLSYRQTSKDFTLMDSNTKNTDGGHKVNGFSNNQVSPEPHSSAIELQEAGDGQKDGEEGEKKEEELPMVSIKELFRFADSKDKMLMFFGLICACLNGAALPLMIIVFGEMSDMFIYQSTFENWVEYYWVNISAVCVNTTQDDVIDNPQDNLFPCLMQNNQSHIIEEISDSLTDDFMEQMRKYALYYAVLGFIVWVCPHAGVLNNLLQIRTELFRAILRQEIGWFDTHESGELNTRLADDVTKIQEGIGDKLGQFFQWFSAFITGFIVGFVYGWKLTLVIVAVSPLLVISGGIMAKLGTELTSRELQAYAQAGAVAEEVFSCVRTVTSFGGQAKESVRYGAELLTARSFGLKRGMIMGTGMGVTYFIMFASFGLAFWYGTKLFIEEGFSAGNILVVLFAVVIGAFAIGNAAPNIAHLSKARGAAHVLYHIIDWDPAIDSSSAAGIRPEDIQGNLQFSDVVFQYPSRPDTTILNSLSLSVNIGETVALVGASGCGKSTTVQLLQRFYDVASGQVLIDGRDIKEYNLKWLRQHIGVVSQEPVLFQNTIEENIRFGREGVTLEEIEQACKMANAHDFISKLPYKYRTQVGERGAQLSGGQKQRIAIARALVRDPKILLLDEATSALDTESEAIVQAALDKASEGRTTLVIAHRLSTVRNADKIIGMDGGRVVEQGTHDQLMKEEGIYYTLCTNQTVAAADGDGNAPASPEKNLDFTRSFSVQSGDKIPHKGSHRDRTVSVRSNASQKGLQRGKSVKEQDEEVEEEEEDLPPAPAMRVLQMNAPEWPFIAIGCVAAIICGCVQPAFAIIFAEILGAFSNVDQEELEREANMFSVLFVIIGAINGLSMFIQSTTFARSGEYLTMRIRQQTFDSYLRQEIAYYDNPKNNTGALCTRLSTDAAAVQGATGARLGTLLQSFASIGCGLTIGFVYSWKLTLFIVAFAPFIMVAGFLQMKVFTGTADGDMDKLEEAGKIATEAIENMRTVATLTKEEMFYKEYYKLTSVPTQSNIKKAQIQGAVFGFAQATIYFAYAACFTMGAYLVDQGELTYEEMFKVFSAIVFSAQSVGEASSFAPDYGKAKAAAARLFALYDRQPSIDSSCQDGNKLSQVTGTVNLSDVVFHYPMRPDIPVLQSLSLEALQGRTVALVGSSGCGKSTVIQLVQRFYDPQEGAVSLEGSDVRGLHLQWVRSQMGVVSQEPVLFDCSIRENIAYGDNSRQVPMDEIIQAAKNANIHNFIQTLPNGYETNVGDKGTQLSGGQKQRVAIARALVRNPRVLLLDEATSALDTESEKVVQEALDKAQEGRTSIVIAHRLSTIQGADLILVMESGRVVEAGTHGQLLDKKGFYYRLSHAQKKHQ